MDTDGQYQVSMGAVFTPKVAAKYPSPSIKDCKKYRVFYVWHMALYNISSRINLHLSPSSNFDLVNSKEYFLPSPSRVDTFESFRSFYESAQALIVSKV